MPLTGGRNLLQQFSHPAPSPLVAGTHLIAHSCYRTIDRNGQFVLLGSAPDPRIQAEFDALANQVGQAGGVVSMQLAAVR